MQYELQATTAPGRRLVAIAEEMIPEFAVRAGSHDREGSYPFKNIEALKASGYFAAPVPEAYGGLGVESIHDLLIASSRLARGDASTTIGVNMHIAMLANMARSWRVAVLTEDDQKAEGLARLMAQFASSGAVVSSAISEPDQDLSLPRTTAMYTRSGWSINGTKIFATMSPAATHFGVGLRFINEKGEERYGFATVPANAPGVILKNDWDALGMRGSGSGSVRFDDVRVPHSAVRDAFPAGGWSTGLIDRFLPSGPMHAAAALGVGESAYAQSVATVATRRKGRSGRAVACRPTMQIRTSENTVDLAAARALLARAGTQIDQYYAAYPAGGAPIDVLHGLNKEVQAAKAFIQQAAQRIVDRAMTMTGGGAFMASHPLARLYRDVRATGFMHPLGDNIAHEYIGQVVLGLEPEMV